MTDFKHLIAICVIFSIFVQGDLKAQERETESTIWVCRVLADGSVQINPGAEISPELESAIYPIYLRWCADTITVPSVEYRVHIDSTDLEFRYVISEVRQVTYSKRIREAQPSYWDFRLWLIRHRKR